MNVDLIDMQDRTKGGFYWYFVAVDEFSSLLHLAGNKSKHKEGVEQGLQNIVKPYNAQRHKVKCPHNPRLCPTPLPPLEETSMDTQSPRAVRDPPLGLGPIPMGDIPRGPLRACPRFAPPPRDSTSRSRTLSLISVSRRGLSDRRTGTGPRRVTPPF